MKRELYEALAKLCAEHGSAAVIQGLADALAMAADVAVDFAGDIDAPEDVVAEAVEKAEEAARYYRAIARPMLRVGQRVHEYEAANVPDLGSVFEILAQGEELEATLDQRHAETP